jgi:hypothetical protein
MKHRVPFAMLIPALVAAIAMTGCNSPTEPAAQTPDPPPAEAVPIRATINKIIVTKFPEKKSDGSDWDLSLLVASRRPDLYVVLEPSAGGAADFVSTTVADAPFGGAQTFTQAVSGGLPADIAYGSSRRIYVMDEDFGGDDDQVGWITVNLPLAYGGGGARALDYTFADSGNRLNVRVVGTWYY